MSLSVGMETAKPLLEKLQPMPNMISEFRRKWYTVFGMERPPDPSESW